jgi:hypothetical protein
MIGPIVGRKVRAEIPLDPADLAQSLGWTEGTAREAGGGFRPAGWER